MLRTNQLLVDENIEVGRTNVAANAILNETAHTYCRLKITVNFL